VLPGALDGLSSSPPPCTSFPPSRARFADACLPYMLPANPFIPHLPHIGSILNAFFKLDGIVIYVLGLRNGWYLFFPQHGNPPVFNVAPRKGRGHFLQEPPKLLVFTVFCSLFLKESSRPLHFSLKECGGGTVPVVLFLGCRTRLENQTIFEFYPFLLRSFSILPLVIKFDASPGKG